MTAWSRALVNILPSHYLLISKGLVFCMGFTVSISGLSE